ncbi:Tat pathway signal sequence domain protein [Kitasatospora sp. CM 4170]|uniref:Tat pathway signal sequence domain protein n=1 Tax=Kitasatospora aburaviensis TaxID=67265 RepID=A0ABW1EYF9_9ACTN|nr:Tat pathway signal sequence domain protein [Kitasatospora sp. CM 4170]WNM49644.1 Tat pathway signal sequence domain protein [Kitasatospora sp. CM 4170]
MRFRRHLALTAAVAALALGAVPASATAGPAAATPVLTTGSAGGAAVAAGDSLAAPLAAGTRATFYSTATSTTGVTCAVSQLSAKAVSNPAAPGVATESLTGLTFGTCTSNVTGVTSVRSLTVGNLPYGLAVDDAPGLPVTLTGGAAGPIQATAVLNSWFGTITCTYQLSGAFTGNADNAAHSLAFRNEHFAKSGGSVLCPGDGYFSATYGPVTDTSQPGSPAVFVN